MKQLLPILITTALFLFPTIVRAQTYTPSNRTPQADNSQIGTQISGTNNNFNITGGLQRGQNLFHSFTDFSVPTNGSANFTNLGVTQSIITRVTGDKFSDINGLVNTNGANFLLINPNGVVFGTNAKLNVGKAFVTSTATGVDFVDAAGKNYNFGVNQAGDALLKIDPNVAFNPARLIIGETIPGSKGIENYGTLQTNNPGQYIGLIGGNVNFYGGQIIAPGAKVELGGLVQNGTIGFSFDNGVKFPVNVDRGNVSLVSSGIPPSVINVESGGGGSVGIVAKDITIQGAETSIKAGIAAGLVSPTAIAGDIKLDATGNIRLSDASAIVNTVNIGAVGKGGNIEIVTHNLFVTGGAQLAANTEGKGDAGNIKITAIGGNISFDGFKDGLAINGSKADLASAAFSESEQRSEGKGGTIEIVTRNLSVTNGAALNVSTYAKGDAGNINIIATDNAIFDRGKEAYSNGARSTVEKGAEGKGGTIKIVTRNLSISNSSQITASTDGKGSAGDIFIDSNTIKLNNGKIFSKSTNSTGGNINLFTNDYLLLQQNSFIATNSDSTGKNGNGGNITINSPLIVALPGNNDITANANQGNGGRVKIDSQGLFGIKYRPQGTEFTNDITASSTFGQSGSVQISTPGTDPGKNKGELAEAPNDASKQISQACGASQPDNKFYITGRGGLPPNANEALESEALWEDARAVKTQPAPTATQPPQFTLPAVGWVVEPNGRVRLIAAQTGAGAAGTSVVCPTVMN